MVIALLAYSGMTPRKKIFVACLKALLLAFCVVVLWVSAFRNGIEGHFFYDEAVYANLAEHPLVSDYYPDPIFFRHPPFIYTFYFILSKIFSAQPPEVLYRVSSLVLVSLGIVFFGLSLSAVVEFPLLTALALGSLVSSPLFVKYSLSSTMYPALFLFLQILLFGLVKKSRLLVNLGFILLIYTHYLGFILLCLYGLALLLKGKRLREIFKEHRVVVFACAPIAVLVAVGVIYHAARSNPINYEENYFSLFFYVPLSGWFALYPALKIRQLKNMEALPMLLFFSTVFLLVAFVVAPPYKRFLYAALPFFLFLGTIAIGQIVSRLSKRAKAVLVPLICIMYFSPAHAFPAGERELFDDCFRDDNRLENWKEPVEICADRVVMTNNARSFLYYKSRADSKRYSLNMLEKSGAFVQFDPSMKDFNEKLKTFQPECIAINDYSCSSLRDIKERFSEESGNGCEGVFQKGTAAVFFCKRE